MLILLPILLLLLAAAALALLGWLRPKFTYHWLVAAGGAFLAWVGAWVLRSRLPTTHVLSLWEPHELLPMFPELLADAVSWPLALALVTLCLGVIFTDVGRASETSWRVWTGDLGITALGVLAVMAGNPLTLIMAWTLIDVLKVIILLRQVEDRSTRRRVIAFFSANTLGIMLVFWAMMDSLRSGTPLTFNNVPSSSAVFLIAAAGLRLGALPLQVAFLREPHQNRGQGTLIHLIPPAASLVLLVRTAHTGIPQTWESIFLVFAVLAGVFGGIAWAGARDELNGRVYWMVGVSAMAFASAIRSQPAAALSWSVTLLYLGAVLFLASARERRFLPIGLLALFNLSSLPHSPTFTGAGLYSPFNLLIVFLLVAQAALLIGFVKHMLPETAPLAGVERWVLLIYPLGLTLLPATHLLAGNWLLPDLGAPTAPPTWPSLVVLGLALVAGLLAWRGVRVPERVFSVLEQIFSLRWVYTFLGWIYIGLGQVLAFVTHLLEGEGGVLWAMLLVALLVSLISQIGAGAGG